MASTKVGIVYALGSNTVRRWIVPDNDYELIANHKTAPGEAMILVDRAQIPDEPNLAIAFVENAVERVTGKPVGSARCVIVDKDGNVTGTIMADPALDAVEGATLVAHETADVGWSLTGDVLAAPLPVAGADLL